MAMVAVSAGQTFYRAWILGASGVIAAAGVFVTILDRRNGRLGALGCFLCVAFFLWNVSLIMGVLFSLRK
jgi:hypothetical protein